MPSNEPAQQMAYSGASSQKYFNEVCSDVSAKIEQTDFVLEQVRNTSFNLKTMISTLKVQISE
jgi:hypothetical protein